MIEDKTLEQELAEAAGETHYRRVSPLELNEVSLNGDGDAEEIDGKLVRKGGYFRKRIYTGQRNRKEKPEEIDLGQPIKVVFLRNRRKLVERGGNDGKILRSTNEHNGKKDAVMLYHTATKQSEAGIALDLRERYTGLKTVELIYALLITEEHDPELVRIPVKGASLGSEAKADTTTSLYSYFGKFSPDEHMWEYYTTLHAVLEKGKKTYFVIDFKRGGAIDGETLHNFVAPALRQIRDNIAALDKQRNEEIAKGVTAPAVEVEVEVQEEPANKYPEDDINPDDIPF